jgi:hypothetical protein
MPRNNIAEKERKRRAVAEATLAGTGTKNTARTVGCSERHVRRLAAEPETQFLITEALRPYTAKLNKLAAKAITAVEEALIAMKTDEADHVSRLRAVERYGDVLELAQGKLPEKTEEEAGPPQWTWEEFCQMYNARKKTAEEEA